MKLHSMGAAMASMALATSIGIAARSPDENPFEIYSRSKSAMPNGAFCKIRSGRSDTRHRA